MKVVSINTATPEKLQVGKKSVITGIFKKPQNGSILINELGLSGDTIVNKKFHGGVDQAIYLYSAKDYAWWQDQLGRELQPGIFGENLTISDYHDGDLRVGDRLLLAGTVLLEISAPRVPCAQFTTRMGDGSFAKKFIAAQRPGAYARVLVPGEIEAGCEIEWQPTDQDYATINEIFIEWHRKSWSQSMAKKALNSPISMIARDIIQQRSGVVV
ncbi:MOSC domain-containing protein [Alcanivorax sp. 1008]|uniref:MOSC domain-containing protein n=1 Tax=Alcanivorax sp. 1008 TaxID=2816853 RepID=UPI001DE1B884|nr:MOSC domain-containing protein [Alcanivorax sp. 1008]MCC1496966.1 MOSC domain-containing protein [Alcanivorax sp. 1008]